jgi:hypothetical protein
MSTAAIDHPGQPRRGAGRVLAVVLGSILALVAFALLAAGAAVVWADQTQRDADGYFTTAWERYDTPRYALTYERIELGDVSETPGWIVDRFGTVRVRASSASESDLFVGIGPADAVAAYLAGVGHDEIVDGLDRDDLRTTPGAAPSSAPGEQEFWAASTSGGGHESLTWDVEQGTWSVVAMNADGSANVSAEVEVGANPDGLLGIGLAVLAIAVAAGAAAAALIVLGMRTSAGGGGGGAVAVAGGATTTGATTYPVAVEARLEEPLSRWLWLVKWLLAIPHVVVLAFLWLAFAVLTVVAWFAILVTGRYPRGIFDFNVGVLRWTWRVGYYAVAGIGTDRYPRFGLGAEPDDAATLDVPYPERLSRGLVLVKSWLLAIPHLIVVALFTGSAVWGWSGRGVQWPGLIGLLTVVAGVILLFRNRYPADLHELIVGLNRWVYRVVAYVALMRDEYPPFRLDQGPRDPGTPEFVEVEAPSEGRGT